MNKFLVTVCFLVGASAFAQVTAAPVDMTKAADCILQEVKEGTPSFTIQCGMDVVMTHEAKPYSQIADQAGYKAGMTAALKQMMGGSVSCELFETQALFWVICKR